VDGAGFFRHQIVQQALQQNDGQEKSKP